MEFKDLDGDKLKVSAGRKAVLVQGWSGGEFTFLAFDPDTADEIAAAITAAGRSARSGE